MASNSNPNRPEPQALNVVPLNSMPYIKPTNEEWHNISLGGSVAAGEMTPLLGRMDIGESDDSYIFRVALPGVSRDDFSCDVSPDGQVLIKGVTTTGEKTVYRHSMKFEMKSQNLCPPGLFTISFKLPGPVDSRNLTAHLGIDGIFEGVLKKKITSN